MEKEIILSILNGLAKNNIAYFTINFLKQFGFSKPIIQKAVKELNQEGLIKNTQQNGFYQRVEIYKYLPCYEFLLNPKYNVFNKINILKIVRILPEIKDDLKENLKPRKLEARIGLEVEKIYRFKDYLKSKGTTLIDVLNNEIKEIKEYVIKENFGLYINQDGNMQIDKSLDEDVLNIKESRCKCKHCGTTNPDDFAEGRISVCKKCTHKINYEKIKSNIAQYLIYLTQYNNKKREKYKGVSEDKVEYDLTERYIEYLLKKQNNKCYYTGLDLDLSLKDKLRVPSVDRIDSNKGYIEGNVCICCAYVNKMKNDLNIEEFKLFITSLYKNLENF